MRTVGAIGFGGLVEQAEELFDRRHFRIDRFRLLPFEERRGSAAAFRFGLVHRLVVPWTLRFVKKFHPLRDPTHDVP